MKIQNKYIILFICISMFCILLVGCKHSKETTDTKEEYSVNNGILSNSDTKFKIYVDEETGVNYIIYSPIGLDKGGITPRYNADGTLYVSPIEK